MFALLNILYLLLPISQTGSEVGVNLLLGPNLEYTQIAPTSNQSYFFEDEDFQVGFHYGLGAYYNYYLSHNYYIGLKATYNHYNTTFREYEPELINIDGQAVQGEFEHYFDYDLDAMNLAIGGGYRLNQQFAVGFGLLYSMPITDYTIHSKETIVKPADAGVFKEEGTRIRNEKKYTTPSVSSKFGATVEVNVLFPMNKSETIFLKPSIAYSYMFTNNLVDLESWKTDFIDLSLGVSFALGENDILGEKNKIIEPEFTFALFELDGTTESSARKVKLPYIEAIDLSTKATRDLVLKSDKKLVVYVGIKNKLQRVVSFEVIVGGKSKYQLDNLEKSNRLEVNLSNLVSSINQREVTFKVATNDGFADSFSLPLEYENIGNLSYIISNDSDKILDYLQSHNTGKFRLYTSDKAIYKLLNKIAITNVTVLTKEDFNYHLDELGDKNYLLVIE